MCVVYDFIFNSLIYSIKPNLNRWIMISSPCWGPKKEEHTTNNYTNNKPKTNNTPHYHTDNFAC